MEIGTITFTDLKIRATILVNSGRASGYGCAWCTYGAIGVQGTVLYEKERRTDGENLAIKYYFAFSSRSLVLADAEEANKVIIIAPISESDTLLFAVSH